jgi:hypothetical protein
MATVTVIWAAAAEVITMDGAEDAVTTMVGHAVIIVTITDTPRRRALSVVSCAFSAADDRFVPTSRVSRCLGS